MEPLRQELTIDSFSYNWLLNIKPSIDSLDDGLCFSLDFKDAGSFIEMDPKLISMRWKADSLDFDFSLPSSQSPVLVHADHIFSNGLLLPLDHLINPPINELLAANSFMNAGLKRSLSIDSSKSLLSGSNRARSAHFILLELERQQKQVTFLGGLHEVFQEVLPKVLEFSNASVQEVQGLEIDREGGKLSSEELHGIDRSIPEDQ